MPFGEARERLQNRIKQDNAELKQMEKEMFDTKRMVDNYASNIKEIDNDLKEKGNGGVDEQKYEILYMKEKEINEFSEQFEKEKVEYEKEIQESQLHISSLLEHMQKTMQRQNKLPTQSEVSEMRSDLKFKQGQLEDSETTAARLRVSKEQAQNDLEKVKTLDKRISNEKQQANLKIEQMQDEMSNKFTKTDELKDQFEKEKVRLTLIQRFLNVYRVGLDKQVAYHQMKHNTKKN